MIEVWKDVKGFEGRFKVSNYGRVLSINGKWKGEKILTPNLQKSTGYYFTTLRWIKQFRQVRVHTLVAEAFIGSKPNGQRMTVNHKNGIKTDNRAENLEWIESKANCAHAVATGLHNLKGENHPNCKLTDSIVHAIKYLFPSISNSEIANTFNISRRHVSDIRRGVCWPHITTDYNPSS